MSEEAENSSEMKEDIAVTLRTLSSPTGTSREAELSTQECFTKGPLQVRDSDVADASFLMP